MQLTRNRSFKNILTAASKDWLILEQITEVASSGVSHLFVIRLISTEVEPKPIERYLRSPRQDHYELRSDLSAIYGYDRQRSKS
jgi:hypothetical protein